MRSLGSICRRWLTIWQASAARVTLPTILSSQGIIFSAFTAEEKQWHQATSSPCRIASSAVALAGAALLWPADTTCEARTQAPVNLQSAPTGLAASRAVVGDAAGSAAVPSSSTSNTSWCIPAWLTWIWDAEKRAAYNEYLATIERNPREAVVMAFALPSLSLSFGYVPPHNIMEAAAALVSPHLPQCRAWEVVVLLWGAARLGYHPRDDVMQVATHQLAQALALPPGVPGALTPQEAAMVGWALAALDNLTPELWAAVNTFLGQCPPASVDEVALIHLYQAALFADRLAVTAPAHPLAPPAAGYAQQPPPGQEGGTPLPAAAAAAHLPRLRSPSQEVRATLAAGGCPLPLISRYDRCAPLRSAAAGGGGRLRGLGLLQPLPRPGHDGPAAVPSFTGCSLCSAHSTPHAPPACTTAVQAAVEDGLVHVDIALPDYKVAFFLLFFRSAQSKRSSTDVERGRALFKRDRYNAKSFARSVNNSVLDYEVKRSAS